MSIRVKAVLFGILLATALGVSACSELKWQEAPHIENEQGHSPFEGGQFPL
jgi:hypothetical protein